MVERRDHVWIGFLVPDFVRLLDFLEKMDNRRKKPFLMERAMAEAWVGPTCGRAVCARCGEG
jgi:hypothetical protein